MAMPEVMITRALPGKRKSRPKPAFSLVRDCLEGLDVRRGGALLALRRVVRDLLAILQRFVAGALNRAVMAEQILAAVVRRDESEAFGVVEPLHGTSCHVVHFLSNCAAIRACIGHDVQERESTATGAACDGKGTSNHFGLISCGRDSITIAALVVCRAGGYARALAVWFAGHGRRGPQGRAANPLLPRGGRRTDRLRHLRPRPDDRQGRELAEPPRVRLAKPGVAALA